MILPKNCRYIQKEGNMTFLVIEENPNIRPIRFHYSFSNELVKIKNEGIIDYNSVKKMINGDINVLRLMYPYTIFIMALKEFKDFWEIRSFRVFFRIHPIKKLNDYLFYANAFNLSDRNDLCFGGSVNLNKADGMDMVSATESVIRQYWIRPFTHEYITRYNKYANTNILNNFLTWSYYSERDPLFIYSAKWLLHDRNIIQEVEAMSMETDGSLTQTRFHSLFVDSVEPVVAKGQHSFENMKLITRILSIGDKIHFGDADLYVYNFTGNKNGPTHIILSDKEGKQVEPVKITATFDRDWETK